MKFAAVDIGNTFVKVSSEDGDVYKTPNLGEALDYCSKKKMENVAYCSTRKIADEDLQRIKAAGWWELRYDVSLPIELRYETPETLGIDRLAGAIAANEMFPGQTVLIADVGTALTIDLVLADGVYMGGNISPGLQMRLDALHHFTSRLPQVGLEGETSFFGTDTEKAIRSGAKWGVVNEIMGAACIAGREYGCTLVVITGTGSDIIEEDLRKEASNAEVRIEKYGNLVLAGLKKAYYYNHEL